MSAARAVAGEQYLKRTRSRCPTCHADCPAEVWRTTTTPSRVLLKRTCTTHGEAVAVISSDARFYWLSQGDPGNSACCAGGTCRSADGTAEGTLGRNVQAATGPDRFATLATCLALIEIVDSCNLACPVCYSDSPVGVHDAVRAHPLAELQARIQGVIDRKGRIEILQLSGGEPTLHPHLFELLRWAQEHPRIDYLLLNTNGVRIAQEAAFAQALAQASRRKKLQLYLQFDGVQAAGQAELRGTDLRALRERAIARCAAMDLPVTLAMTVTPQNLAHVWEAVVFGLDHPHVHGITFQPQFHSGRTPGHGGERLNTADVILAAVEQARGRLRFEDFTPLPCGDPNCATIGYLLRAGGRTWSISEFVDFARLQGFLQDKVHYTLEDLARCGCESEPLGELLRGLELSSASTFRLFVKPFMDAWSWDQDRIDRCCTHVIRPDGALDSFCRYYSGFPDTRPAP